MIDSRIVLDRERVRSFLSNPPRELPGARRPVGVGKPAQLERLLDYPESL